MTHRPEIERLESRSRELPQRLPPPPVAVSGRLSRLTEVDRYEFVADRDGLVIAELWARRLGSDFQGQLEVRDEAGRLLADFADTEGDGWSGCVRGQRRSDVHDGVQDVDFRGDRAYVYRLVLASGPKILATLPAAGVRGATVDTEFIGWGVATGGARLETLRDKVAFPADGQSATHAIAGWRRSRFPWGTAPKHPSPVSLPRRTVRGPFPETSCCRGIGRRTATSCGLSGPSARRKRGRWHWNPPRSELARLAIDDPRRRRQTGGGVDDLPVGTDAFHEFASVKGDASRLSRAP